MIEDFGPEIELLATGTYTVTRRASTSYIDGREVAAVEETLQISAMAHPVSGGVLARLPEGLRGRESIGLYTVTELRSIEGGGRPDTVVVEGVTYQVAVCKRWKELGNFFEVVGVRADL